VGVDMKITPHITQGKLIRLNIDSKFTQQVESVTGLGPETPTTSKRSITTEVTMYDGSSIVIGGLIRDNKTVVESKIPILGDLPILGGLFRSKRDLVQKTNLLLFITPHILSTQQEIAKKSQEKQDDINLKTAQWKEKYTPQSH